MSSTEQFRRSRCSKCGGDAIQVNRMHGDSYVCECACGHVYLSKSTAAGAAYAVYLKNNK